MLGETCAGLKVVTVTRTLALSIRVFWTRSFPALLLAFFSCAIAGAAMIPATMKAGTSSLANTLENLFMIPSPLGPPADGQVV